MHLSRCSSEAIIALAISLQGCARVGGNRSPASAPRRGGRSQTAAASGCQPSRSPNVRDRVDQQSAAPAVRLRAWSRERGLRRATNERKQASDGPVSLLVCLAAGRGVGAPLSRGVSTRRCKAPPNTTPDVVSVFAPAVSHAVGPPWGQHVPLDLLERLAGGASAPGSQVLQPLKLQHNGNDR